MVISYPEFAAFAISFVSFLCLSRIQLGLLFTSVAVIKCQDQKLLEDERFIIFSRIQSITEGSQDRNLESGIEAETVGNAPFWFALLGLPRLISYTN